MKNWWAPPESGILLEGGWEAMVLVEGVASEAVVAWEGQTPQESHPTNAIPVMPSRPPLGGQPNIGSEWTLSVQMHITYLSVR